ncbi:MAG: antibiotic biosynthesis monooxygenase [Lentisphaeria bacterium]|nr:antibiotic biosynthesis monooxygenase [Lentisphaeria bacterium]
MIYVIAESVLKPGCREEFIRLAKANIPTVRAEKGCISYDLNSDCTEGPAAANAKANVLTFVECWESLEALQAHLAAPHMKAFVEKVRPLREGNSLKVVTPV